MYVWTYAGLCRAPRIRLCLLLNLNLDLSLNLGLYPALNRALVEKPYRKSSQKPIPMSVLSSKDLKYRELFVPSCPAVVRQTQSPG